MGKGSDKEREAARMIHDAGLSVMRSPSSGGGTKREQPDLAVWETERVYAFESKYGSSDVLYVQDEEMVALRGFNSTTSVPTAEGMIARFKGDTSFYVVLPNQADRTPSGSYRLVKEDRGGYVSLSEWLEPTFGREWWYEENS